MNVRSFNLRAWHLPEHSMPLSAGSENASSHALNMAYRVCALAFALQVVTASALTIQIDYSYDAATDNFFGQNTTARSALEQAAGDLSAAITSTLAAVPTDKFTGTNGTTTVTFDWSLRFENPSIDGVIVTLPTFSFPTDVFTIYVGMRPLMGTTLGEGGPAGMGFSAGASGSSGGYEMELPGAVDAAEAASNNTLTRGAGPVIGSLQGNFGSPGSAYDLLYGPLAGTLWFDNDTNNDSVVDDATRMNNFWHFNAGTAVAAGKNDFYSVALHEMLHTLGFGSSDEWDSLVSGTDWLGPEASALNGGSGVNLISGDGAHLRSSLQSPRLSDGVLAEVVMDPSLTTGTRKTLTQMDLAMLRDLGYATVPEPTTAALLAMGTLVVFSVRRRGRISPNLP